MNNAANTISVSGITIDLSEVRTDRHTDIGDVCWSGEVVLDVAGETVLADWIGEDLSSGGRLVIQAWGKYDAPTADDLAADELVSEHLDAIEAAIVAYLGDPDEELCQRARDESAEIDRHVDEKRMGEAA